MADHINKQLVDAVANRLVGGLDGSVPNDSHVFIGEAATRAKRATEGRVALVCSKLTCYLISPILTYRVSTKMVE